MPQLHFANIAWIAWFRFLIHYRRTILGPAWLLIAPAAFIAIVGPLFTHVSGMSPSLIIPSLAIGLVVWNFISGCVVGSTTLFQRTRSQILQGENTLLDLAKIDVLSTLLQASHQALIIVGIFLIFGLGLGIYAIVSLVGVALLIANGLWVTMLFGVVGARYRDLSELVQAVMRIAFLATPIIWMPGESMRGGILGVYLVLNPFYHFLEVVRAPLLGNSIAPLSWAVVLGTTIVGWAVTRLVTNRFARFVPLWV